MVRMWVATAAFCLATAASAEPIGEWYSGFGQGVLEYGVKNDSAGSDTFSIACDAGGTLAYRTTINLIVGGKDPKPGTIAVATVGEHEYQIMHDSKGDGTTACHACAANFDALWAAMRAGTTMWVRLSTGESTKFTLAGAAKALPKEPCKADYYR